MNMKQKTRGNGQGCAYRRKRRDGTLSPTWTACAVVDWRFPADPSKPRIPIKRTKGGFPTKRDALAYCPVLRAGGIEKPKEAPRLSYYWDIYSNNKMLKIGKSKQSAYKTAWNKMKKLHDARVSNLTIEVMQETVSTVASTYYTQKDCRTVLTKLFELAYIDGYVVRDLPLFIEIVPLEESEQIPFNKEEQKALWKLYESGNQDACIPLLMIYTGMMPGEAMKLKVEHINLEEKTMFGMNLKTKVRKRTPVVLSSTILPVVEDLIANARPNGYIWPRNETAWYERYYNVLELANCRHLPPYSCRHTTATALAIDKKIAPQTIKRIMRWSTVKMLDKYAHPSNQDALKAVNKLKK